MTVANETVYQVWDGNDVTTSFTIPFDFLDEDVIAVYLIESDTETKQTITTHYTLTGGPPVTTVEMNTAPTSSQKLKIIRETPIIQEDDYTTSYVIGTTLETALDNLVRMIQEAANNLASNIRLAVGSALTNIRLPVEAANKYLKWNDDATALENVEALPTWGTGTDYKEGNFVYEDGAIYRAASDHTAGVFADDLYANLWTAISGGQGAQGTKGDKGDKGDAGPAGATGAAGANGAPGANGIFSEIASQAEAQAGVDNTKGMSPLRVKQAIDSQVNPTNIASQISALQTADTGLATDIAAVSNRVTTLENQLTSSEYYGSQRLLNNQAVAVQLEGANGEAGLGNEFSVSAAGTTHAEFTVRIYRKDDVTTVFTTAKLLFHYIDGNWNMARIDTSAINSDDDGVTFSIQQVGQVAYVYYTSSNMNGGNYDSDSRLTWVGEEIPVGI